MYRKKNIPLPLILLVLCALQAKAQTSWSQEVACPGWYNTTTFITGDSSYYYTGNFGQRQVMVPNIVNGSTGISNGSTGLAATVLSSITTTALHHSGNLPQRDNRFAIMTDTLGYDSNTGGALPYVPTHMSHSYGPYDSHYTSSIRIGNDAESESQPASTLRYTFMVTPDNAIFTLLYAIVAQEPVHDDEANPLFLVRLMRNVGSNADWQNWSQISDTLANLTIINNTTINPVSSASDHGWHSMQADGHNVYYHDWDRMTIDLSPYIDSTISIEVTVSGCAYSTHWAYAYIAGDCRPAKVDYLGSCLLPQSVVAPDGMLQYRWTASDIGDSPQPYDAIPMHTLLPAFDSGTLTLSDQVFHVSRRINSSGDTVAVDSIGTCQVVGCEMTSCLDPLKPVTTRHFLRVCRNTLQVSVDTVLSCNGTAQLTNRSSLQGDNTSLALPLTQWQFFNDADINATPFAILTGNPVNVDLAGHSAVGVLMTTLHIIGSDTCHNDTIFIIHPHQQPTLTIAGQTNIPRDSLTNLTASSTTPGTTFQWSTSSDSVTGGIPTGPQLHVVPYADIATYYVRAISPSGCSTWDSVRLFRYNPRSSEIAAEIFNQVRIDSIACLGNAVHVAIGSDTNNEVVIANRSVTLSHPDTTFLPDGVPCGTQGCSYRSNVTFNQFADGATVQTVNDIKYVRLNMEHSYIGDIYINITCPNGQRASLMNYGGTGTSECTSSILSSDRGWRSGANASTSTFLGNARDGENASSICDGNATGNEPGSGWNYCWSNNTDMGYRYAPGDGIIYRQANVVTLPNGSSVIDSSNVAAHSNFYHPEQSFSSLVGCPLNGDWYIEVQDGWSMDNGYIFDWELSLKASTVDSINIVRTDIMGNQVVRTSDTSYVLSAPPTATGDTTVEYIVLLFDEEGLAADSSVWIHFVAPTYDSEALTACEGTTLWAAGHPYRESAHFIDTTLTSLGCLHITDWDIRINPVYKLYDTAFFCYGKPLTYDDSTYSVPGTYRLDSTTVAGCDSTKFVTLQVQDRNLRAAVELSDDGERWSRDTMLAGCRPYQVLLHNISTLATNVEWQTGDGGTPEGDSIVYTYENTGVYQITLVATSPHQCRDTAVAKMAVWVFDQAKATFSWNPATPVLSHPTAELIVDEPVEGQQYMWVIQSSSGSGFDTLYGQQPSYTWANDNTPVEGTFDIVLSTLLLHFGPYGDTLVCNDTSQNSITIVSDWLQFPNVVTPNGDGINDHWEVVNLLECGLYSMNELWIYDRWGHEVYHAKNIDKKEDFWYPDDDNCPDGTYYFRFSAKSLWGLIKRNGVIEVVR